MKLPNRDHPMRCGFSEMELNMRVGQLRKYVPGASKVPKPEYLLTRQQFLEQVHEPLYSINLDKGIQDYKLQKHINKIHRALSRKCKGFTRGIPHLPGCQDVACIELITEERGPVSVWLSLSDLYCRGVYLKRTEVIYENIDRDCLTNPTSTGFLVEGSVPLGFLGHSYSKLGFQLPLELNSKKYADSYIWFTRLGTGKQNLGRALFGLGMFAFHFIEPVRQLVVQTFFQPNKSEVGYSEDKYGILYDGDVWEAVHKWGKDCLAAQGLKEESDHILREDPSTDYYGRKAAALANIKMIKYAGILYY